MRKKSNIFGKIIGIIILVILIIILVKVYKQNNFNNYKLAEYKIGLSQFLRDKDVKYDEKIYSYKIENLEFNDAMYFKTINVTPNTVYKVTCMVKTENVQSQNENTNAGAHICISDTTEKSINVTGTSDWTKVEFLFDSKNRSSVDIGFRLGGYDDNCIGTAWFSNMQIESGIKDESNEWNFLCLLFDKVDVNIEKNGKKENIKLTLNPNNIYDIKNSFERFGSTIEELSRNKIKTNTTLIEIGTPITSMTYDEENGYYVSSNNIRKIIDKYIDEDKYDHIFIAFKTGDINEKKEIPVYDWIGLRTEWSIEI